MHKTTGITTKKETTATTTGKNTGNRTGMKEEQRIRSGGMKKTDIVIIEIMKATTIATNTIRNILKRTTTHNGTITIIPNTVGFTTGLIVIR